MTLKQKLMLIIIISLLSSMVFIVMENPEIINEERKECYKAVSTGYMEVDCDISNSIDKIKIIEDLEIPFENNLLQTLCGLSIAVGLMGMIMYFIILMGEITQGGSYEG